MLANGVPAGSAASALWNRVEELVDRAPSVEALRVHRLHLAAARIWRSRGQEVPASLRGAERYGAMIATVAPVLLERARAAYDGQLMLMKGPEVAAWYRDPPNRAFRDLDLLADDAPAAQRALIKSGFAEFEGFGDAARYSDAQHLCPLIWPGLPLVIELHRRPNQPMWLPRLGAAEVLKHGVPSATGVDGLLGPDPAVHALLLVAHSWAHHPLARLRDLLDVAAVLASGGRRRADEVAREWRWHGMWGISLAVTDAVLGDGDWPTALTVWARHLPSARDRTVLENHIAAVAAPASALPLKSVPGALAGVLWRTANRGPEERWADKLHRSRLAVSHALMATSSHNQTLPRDPVVANPQVESANRTENVIG